MVNDYAKKLLSEIRVIDLAIQSHMDELELLKASLLKSPELKEISVQESKIGLKDDTYVKMIELSDEINHKIDELVDKKRQASQLIEGISNPYSRIILRLKYVNYESWNDICWKCRKSKGEVLKLHDIGIFEINSKKNQFVPICTKTYHP